MATLSMKSEIFMTSRFRSGNSIPRPRRMTRPTPFIEHDSLDPELTMAIQESLKISRQNEMRKTVSPKCKNDIDEIASLKTTLSQQVETVACQTDLVDGNGELKKLLKANLDLIQHQQHLIDIKDNEIKALTSVNETLQCRLERMERRMSILKHRDDVTPVVSPSSQQTHKTPNKRKVSTPPEIFCKREAAETCRLINKQENTRGPRRTRHLDISDTASSARITKRSVKDTCIESDEGILRSTDEYHVLPCTAVLRNSTLDTSADLGVNEFHEVEVPSWTVKVFKNIYQMEGTENITDEAYMRRHQKPEMDEKRRKRWDLQRMREEQACERLREKASGDVNKTETPMAHSLYPPLNSISHIEVCDEVPVSVFGRAVPNISQTNFDLPWLNKKAKTARRK